MTTKLSSSDRHTLARQCLRDALHYHKRGHADLTTIGKLAVELGDGAITDEDVEKVMVLMPSEEWRRVTK